MLPKLLCPASAWAFRYGLHHTSYFKVSQPDLGAISPMHCRECVEDTVLGGKRIPAGTKLWINVLAIHHDPAHYQDPEVLGCPLVR